MIEGLSNFVLNDKVIDDMANNVQNLPNAETVANLTTSVNNAQY